MNKLNLQAPPAQPSEELSISASISASDLGVIFELSLLPISLGLIKGTKLAFLQKIRRNKNKKLLLVQKHK